MLRIFTRENKGTVGGKRFVFRSGNMTTFSLNELVQEMATFNTTITEADTLAVLNVMKKLVTKYVKQGYTVQTPLGLFYASASGSTDDDDESFAPSSKENNHDIRMLYRPDSGIVKDVLNNTPCERVSNRLKTAAHIDKVINAGGDMDTAIHAGDTLLITGDYLKFDEEAEEQGVFLVSGSVETKLTYCPVNTKGKIEIRIDSGTAPGTYNLILRNVPSTKLTATEFKGVVVG